MSEGAAGVLEALRRLVPARLAKLGGGATFAAGCACGALATLLAVMMLGPAGGGVPAPPAPGAQAYAATGPAPASLTGAAAPQAATEAQAVEAVPPEAAPVPLPRRFGGPRAWPAPGLLAAAAGAERPETRAPEPPGADGAPAEPKADLPAPAEGSYQGPAREQPQDKLTNGRPTNDRLAPGPPRPVDGAGRLAEGTEHLLRGRLGLSVEALEEAVAAAPSAGAWNNLGAALLRLGRDAEAARCLERALRVAPGHGAALTNLGVVLRRQGDLAGAENLFRRALAAAPACAETHYQLAVLCEATGRPREAREHYEVFLEGGGGEGAAAAAARAAARDRLAALRALLASSRGLEEPAPAQGPEPGGPPSP
jgi:hypothetical protein